MKKIIFTLLIVSFSYANGGLKIRGSLIEMLSPFIQLNKEVIGRVSGLYEGITEINRIREENFYLKNKDYVLVSKDFKERVDLVNLNELEKLKKNIENDDFFKDKKTVITNIIYLDKSNSKIFIRRIEGYGVADTVMIGRFYLGLISAVNSTTFEVELWNKKDMTINSYVISSNSEKLTMNVRSENFNTSFIENILSTEDVKIGDVVVTSSTNSNVPKDLFLGVIDRVEGVSSQTFRKALIKKQYDLERSNYVILMKHD